MRAARKTIVLAILMATTPALGKLQMGGLFKAISNYDYEAVRFLLNQRGARKIINSTYSADSDVFTPLQWAVHVVVHGSYRDEYKYLKLPNIAERAQALKIIELILLKGGNPDVYDFNGETLLHRAARNLNLPLLEVLLTNKADINARNAAGETVLHIIARDARAYRERGKVADFLLIKGADPTIANTADQLAIDIAKSSGDETLAKVLSNNWWVTFNKF